MAEQVKDYYGILGIEATATDKEIHKAYRALSKKHHPDVSKEENAHEIFQRIYEAYETLKDEETRKEYDDYVAEHERKQNAFSFEHFFSQYKPTFNKPHVPLKGQDVEMDVYYTIEELKSSATKEVTFERYLDCQTCDGRGKILVLEDACTSCSGKGYKVVDKTSPFGSYACEETCSSCGGLGYEADENAETCSSCKGKGTHAVKVRLKLVLKKEIYDGYELRLRGKGDEGMNGGAHGDLYLTFRHDIEEDTYSLINDFDLKHQVNVPFLTALVGGEVKFTLPTGKDIMLPITKGTQSGHQIIIPDEGLYDREKQTYGNIYGLVNVLTPEDLSEEKMKQIIAILK